MMLVAVAVAVAVVVVMKMKMMMMMMLMMLMTTTRAEAAATTILPFVVCCSNYNSYLNILHSMPTAFCLFMSLLYPPIRHVLYNFLTIFITARSCKMMIVTWVTNN